MTTKLYILKEVSFGEEWTEIPVYNRFEHDERLDEQLDTGSIMTINEVEEPFAEYTLFKVVVSDEETEKELFYFGFDTVEARGENYFIHTIELTELTRWTMGLFIDGRSITQPITGARKTLHQVFVSFLKTAKLIKGYGETLFYSGLDEQTRTLMESVASPEFYWSAGTSVWECLCDIGNVVNCIPRVEYSAETKHFTVKYERVNEVTSVYEL